MKVVIEVPEGWVARNCPKCDLYYICGTCGYDRPLSTKCPLDSAVEVVEIPATAELETAFVPGSKTDPGVHVLCGKVVRVFATVAKKVK